MFKRLLILSIISCTINAQSTEKPKMSFFESCTIPECVKNHPKKTVVGTGLTLYGAKLLYEGSKTLHINQGDVTYDRIGKYSYIIGGAMILVGGVMLYKVVSSENENILQESPSK